MSKRRKILELLTQNDLTTKEIQEKTSYDLNLIQVYINQFKKEGKIKKVGNKGQFAIYTAKVRKEKSLALLKQLHSIMEKRMDFVQKPTDTEIKTIKIIEEMIK